MHVLDKADPVCWLQPFNETLGGHDSEKCSGHQKSGWNPVGARDYQPRYAVLLRWCHRPLGCQSWACRNVSLIFFFQLVIFCLLSFSSFLITQSCLLQRFFKFLTRDSRWLWNWFWILLSISAVCFSDKIPNGKYQRKIRWFFDIFFLLSRTKFSYRIWQRNSSRIRRIW